jgi:hypothetical protein
VEGVVAFSEYYVMSVSSLQRFIVPRLTQWTLITRKLALGTSTIVWITADTADVVVGHVPAPGGDSVPFSYGDLHGVACRVMMVGGTRGSDGDAKQTRLVLVRQIHGGERGGGCPSSMSAQGSSSSLLRAPHGGDDGRQGGSDTMATTKACR